MRPTRGLAPMKHNLLAFARTVVAVAVAGIISSLARAAESEPLPGTAVLTGEIDRSVAMRDGFRRFLQREIDESVSRRAAHWRRDLASRAAYETSIEPNRARLRAMIGA